MADNRGNLLTLLQENPIEGDFQPYAYYGDEEDALKVFLSDAPDYAKRLNSRVTLYLSLDDSELVGCQIKSVRHVLEDIGWFDVSIKHGKIRLDLLFVAMHGSFDNDPEARELYRRLGASAAEHQLHVDVPRFP